MDTLPTPNTNEALIEFIMSLAEAEDIESDVFALGRVIGWQRLLKRMGALPGVQVQGYENQTAESVARDLLSLIAELCKRDMVGTQCPSCKKPMLGPDWVCGPCYTEGRLKLSDCSNREEEQHEIGTN